MTCWEMRSEERLESRSPDCSSDALVLCLPGLSHSFPWEMVLLFLLVHT